MAIIIGAGMRIGAGMAISSGDPMRSEPITPPTPDNFNFEGDLALLVGSAIDLMIGSGTEDLNLELAGDLLSQSGVEDFLTATGTVDLMV
jgi:hypothetical protein